MNLQRQKAQVVRVFWGWPLRYSAIRVGILSAAAGVGLCRGGQQVSTTMAVIIPSHIAAILENSYNVKTGEPWNLPFTVQTRTEHATDPVNISVELQDRQETAVGRLTCRLGDKVLHCAPPMLRLTKKAMESVPVSQATITLSGI